MGTYAGYTGSMKISPDKQEEFSEAVSKILYYGGMMHLRRVDMDGKTICLLDPVTIEKGQDVDFTYNYFEDDTWENAGYLYNEQSFYSNKIGSGEFSFVIMAVFCLYELYDEEIGLPKIDGDIIDCEQLVGWFNHLLGKKFSLKHRFRLWDIAEHIAADKIEYHDVLGLNDLKYILPTHLIKYAGGVDLTDLLYILNGTETLSDDAITPNTYPEDVLTLKNALSKMITGYGDDSYAKILALLKLSYDERKDVNDSCIKAVAEKSLSMHGRTLLYLFCELTERNFWEEWFSIKDSVYRDEILKEYDSQELTDYRKKGIETPAKDVLTSEFLRNNSYFAFYDTPDELIVRGNYYISDKDRLYWWDGTDEVAIDERTEEWLKKVSDIYKKILADTTEDYNDQTFVKDFVALLYDVDSRYKRVFAFQSMFYQFVQNSAKPEYRAALSLLRKLYEVNKDDAEYLKNVRDWSMMSKNVKCIRGRMEIRRYLALLANNKLREKYLGF